MYLDPLRQMLAQIATTHGTLPHAQKRAYLEREAQRLAMSVQTLYRQLKAVGWTSGRKTRADKGTFVLDDDTLQTIGGLQKVGVRKNGKAVMKIPVATSILTMNGQDIAVTDSTIARNLRAMRMDMRSQLIATPAVEQRSAHPNYCHMADPSLCLLFYMRGRQHIITEDEFYKNKLDAVAKNPLKCWRYVLVDHFSARIVVRYYERKGEDQRTLADFLLYSWTELGVPKFLMLDPGSANTAYTIKHFCEALDVKVLVNKPKGPRAKGGVEVANNIVETNCEARLRVEPVSCIEELNEMATAWVNAYNANLVPGQDTRLRREGLMAPMARMDLFRTIKATELRTLPPLDVCLRLMHGKEIERKVDGELRISFKHPAAERTMPYDVRGLAGISRGDVVKVKPLAYGLAAILVEVTRFDGEALTYRLEPITDWTAGGFRESSPLIGEEYHALPKTDLERTGETLDRTAYGPDKTAEEIEKARANKDVVPFRHINGGTGFQTYDVLKGVNHPAELPKRGTEVVPDVPGLTQPQGTYLEEAGVALHVPDVMSVPVVRLNHVEMAKAMLRLMEGDWTADKFALLVEWYPDGCAEEELQAVADRMKRVGRMKLVS